MPVILERLRNLDFASAASGLVQVDETFYLVADDELHLGLFSLKSGDPGSIYPLFPGILPQDSAPRKRVKPDLEALCFLSEANIPPFGALLAIPSGSKLHRSRGSLISLMPNNGTGIRLPAGAGNVDFRPLFAELIEKIPDLNVEGAAPIGGVLRLFQRGNGESRHNATIDLDLAGLLADLKSGTPPRPELIVAIKNHDLGALKGIPLSFTDACHDPVHGTWFVAAAEDTESTYDDGEYLGAVIGKMATNGEIAFTRQLDCPSKPEGLWLKSRDPVFYVVTDADDAAKRCELFQGKLPLDGVSD